MPKHTGIKKLENGRYQARYFAGFDSKGKRRYPSRTFDLQSDAIKWRAAQVGAKSSGRHFEIHGLTVSQYLDQWLASKKQTLRENSWEMYRYTIDKYVKTEIGHIKLSRLTPLQVEEMQSRLLASVSTSTVLSARILLNGAMAKAVRLGLIPTNPVASTDGPKRQKYMGYPVTVEEALRFVRASTSSRLGLLFELALNTGLRPEELSALRWSDLELGDRGVVHVTRVIHFLRGGGWRWHEPKSENGRRSVVFPGGLAASLTNHRMKQLEHRLRAGQHWDNNDLVFCTSRGTPFKYCNLQKEFKRVLTAAKLPTVIKLYDLRHAFVTFSLLADVDAKTVSSEAGHANVGFTLTRYGHVLKEMNERASDKREQLLKRHATNE